MDLVSATSTFPHLRTHNKRTSFSWSDDEKLCTAMPLLRVNAAEDLKLHRVPGNVGVLTTLVGHFNSDIYLSSVQVKWAISLIEQKEDAENSILIKYNSCNQLIEIIQEEASDEDEEHLVGSRQVIALLQLKICKCDELREGSGTSRPRGYPWSWNWKTCPSAATKRQISGRLYQQGKYPSRFKREWKKHEPGEQTNESPWNWGNTVVDIRTDRPTESIEERKKNIRSRRNRNRQRRSRVRNRRGGEKKKTLEKLAFGTLYLGTLPLYLGSCC